MNDFIKVLLSLSISGSIIGVIIFSLKPLLRHRIPKWIQYYLWIVVLLRLIVPVSFPESIMNDMFSSKINLNTGVNYTSFSQGAKHPTKNIPVFPYPMEQRSYNPSKNEDLAFLSQNYLVFIWLFGLLTILAINVSGYIRFVRFVKKTNTPPKPEETHTLLKLLKGEKIQLFRNPFISTPMLLGLVNPRIIIPNIDFDQKQLSNILLHELTHYRRLDIVIKWLTMLSVAIHWFNPLVYLIKREINNACELACDEGVIKNLNNKDKQSYGDTLIYVVSRYKKAPLGVLQAKMFEEKKTLKERLVSIMKYNKKPKILVFLSVALLAGIVIGGLILGAFDGKTSKRNDAQSETIDNYEIYKNDKYGFSLEILKDFSKQINIDEDTEQNIIYLRYKEISEGYPSMGQVGRIEVYGKNKYKTKEDFKGLEDLYGLKIVGESEKYYFGVAHATDLQIPFEKNHLTENFRSLEKDFDVVVKSFKVYPLNMESDKTDESLSQKDKIDLQYSLVLEDKVISLGSWDTNLEDILGEPQWQNTEILGPNSDTFAGSYVKKMNYDNLEITLSSPKDNGKSFWINKMEAKDNSLKTWDGISLGTSLKELQSTYSDLKVFPDGRTDLNNCGYVLDKLDMYKLMKFEVKDGKVAGISLYIEMP